MKIIFPAFLISIAVFARAADSPYGVCAHLNRMPVQETFSEIKGIKRTGITYIRTDLDWRQVEPAPGKWDFSRWDELVDEARKNGLKLLPILCGEMPAINKGPFNNMDRWLTYVRQCVRRYKGKIDCYEVINEADCDRPWGDKPNPENYTELLKKTYIAIKAIDPKARVIFTGVSDFGNPLEFVERAFRAGAGNWFDVMNFHPYQWRNVPEAQLQQRIRDMKTLMQKYRIDKPIWITEIGNSSAPARYMLAHQIVDPALRRLGFSPEKTPVALIVDTATRFSTGGIDDYLPLWKKRRELSFAQLRTVSVADCPVVALPGREGFPGANIADVENYVRRGGTVILPGGLPFYFDFQAGEAPGLFRTVQADDKYCGRLHLGWESFWVKSNVPRTTQKTVAGEDFPALQLKHYPGMRFLNADKLKGNDKMIPVAYGVNGSYRAPIAALYKLDSDMKGNIIAAVDADGTDSVTEDEQAQLLVREYILALSEGVEKIFNYRFRAGEWNRGREAHFGIVRRNFADKLAQKAYNTLIKQLPPGSSKPQVKITGKLCRATWQRPDGVKVTALWTVFGRENIYFPKSFSGVMTTLDGFSEKTRANVLTVTPAIIYLTSDVKK